jgi:hypothetical protein
MARRRRTNAADRARNLLRRRASALERANGGTARELRAAVRDEPLATEDIPRRASSLGDDTRWIGNDRRSFE